MLFSFVTIHASDERTDRQNCDSNTVRCITCSRTVKTWIRPVINVDVMVTVLVGGIHRVADLSAGRVQMPLGELVYLRLLAM